MLKVWHGESKPAEGGQMLRFFQQMAGSKKLSKGITGIAGEYFVAGELSRREFMASVTLRNNDSIDIHASKLGDNQMFAIQVKTIQNRTRVWPLNKKAEQIKGEKLFYVFVSFKGIFERPDYFIVPSTIVAETVQKEYDHWIKTPGKKGQAHQENDGRKGQDAG